MKSARGALLAVSCIVSGGAFVLGLTSGHPSPSENRTGVSSPQATAPPTLIDTADGHAILPGTATDVVSGAQYGPIGITCPANSIRIQEDQDIQSVIDQHPPRTSFCISKGEYRLLKALHPKTGDEFTFEPEASLNGSQPVVAWVSDGTYWIASEQRQSVPALNVPCELNPVACEYEDLFMDGKPMERVLSLAAVAPGKFFFNEEADRIYVRDDPSLHQFEATVTDMAFNADGVWDVTVRGATIEKFLYHGIETSERWVIDRNEIRYCHSHGIRATRHTTVTGNHIHNNGNMGIFARGENLRFEGNHLAYNNYLNFGKRSGYWHAGAAKVTSGSATVVRRNWSHHNLGDGWWFDADNIDSAIEDNVFEDNARWGLFYEISQAGAVKKNIFRGNRMGGLWVNTSRDLEVAENHFEFNGGFTIGLVASDRGSSTSHGRYRLTNFYAHDNIIKMDAGRIGVSSGSDEVYSGNNRFARNRYHVSDPAHPWWSWQGGETTWREWRSYGQDEGGELRPLDAGERTTS